LQAVAARHLLLPSRGDGHVDAGLAGRICRAGCCSVLRLA